MESVPGYEIGCEIDEKLPGAEARGGWWICGPLSYTLPILPMRTKPGWGFVYGLFLTSGKTKVGMTKAPRRRITLFRRVIAAYGGVDIVAVGLSHPTIKYREYESIIQEKLSLRCIEGELYDCGLTEVGNALMNHGPLTPQLTLGRGRKPRPWYWEARKGWYAIYRGRRFRLADTEDEAKNRLRWLILNPG